jgi:hypothetical protein
MVKAVKLSCQQIETIGWTRRRGLCLRAHPLPDVRNPQVDQFESRKPQFPGRGSEMIALRWLYMYMMYFSHEIGFQYETGIVF